MLSASLTRLHYRTMCQQQLLPQGRIFRNQLREFLWIGNMRHGVIATNQSIVRNTGSRNRRRLGASRVRANSVLRDFARTLRL
jgi:hypothetical protein